MNVPMRTLTLCTAGLFSLSACATKGALKRGLEAQTAALESERAARTAADEQAKQETAAQIASLRTDLQGLRTEFGAKIEQVSQGLQFAFPVHFGFNDANVRDADSAALERFANVVQKHYPGAKITVEGFADPAGSSRYNKALSQRRADAVKAYVAGKGVDASLIQSVGYGETRLVNRAAWGDQPGAELNRRVVFVIETPANADATKVTASANQ
jgi:outer membrane protein OmpA-like peptidoglycan-associated protein